MRWTLLLSMLLAGMSAHAQAANVTPEDAADAAAYAVDGTQPAEPATAYSKLGSASLADAVAALTAVDVMRLDQDVFTHPMLTSDIAPQVHNSPAPVPEPPTISLVAGSIVVLGLLGFGVRRPAPVMTI